MKVIETQLPGVLIIEPEIFRDDRGHFYETWHQIRHGAAGLPERFVQDNLSYSGRGVLRGLHYQHPSAQGKFVSVIRGEIFDVALDIRVGSPTFGQWTGVTLSAENGRQIYIPEGFAHGFFVTGESATVYYKCTNLYDARSEGSILWNDPDLDIHWPTTRPVLSPRDGHAPRLSEIPVNQLPRYRGAGD
jgi:dTDP-4-dehydrorhamnose 3,5-epimerase